MRKCLRQVSSGEDVASPLKLNTPNTVGTVDLKQPELRQTFECFLPILTADLDQTQLAHSLDTTMLFVLSPGPRNLLYRVKSMGH